MKKSILIALAVAVATCAQGQSELGDNPTEYKNPFASLGVYEYVQKQSDGEYGKWFLSGKNAEDRYFTTERGNFGDKGRAAKIIVNKEGSYKDVQFCIVLDISDDFKNITDKHIDISYVIDNKNFNFNYELVVKTETNHSFEKKSIISFNNDDYVVFEKQYNLLQQKTYSENNTFEIKDGKYLYIQFNLGKNANVYWISQISINGYTYQDNKRKDLFEKSYFDIPIYLIQFDSNGGSEIDNMFYYRKGLEHYILDKSLNELAYVKEEVNVITHPYVIWNEDCYPTPIRKGYDFKYWELNGEPYEFLWNIYNDITLTAVWEKNGEIITDITTTINDMESNIYVSNNVLHTDEPSSVYIFNVGGILVKTENNTTSVDLSDLKKGVYIAKVNGAPIKFVR